MAPTVHILLTNDVCTILYPRRVAICTRLGPEIRSEGFAIRFCHNDAKQISLAFKAAAELAGNLAPEERGALMHAVNKVAHAYFAKKWGVTYHIGGQE